MVRFLALLALLCALTCPALAKGFPFNIPLYYNPNGGRYFHTLSNCDSIDPKYWDGMVSFLGAEQVDAADVRRVRVNTDAQGDVFQRVELQIRDGDA